MNDNLTVDVHPHAGHASYQPCPDPARCIEVARRCYWFVALACVRAWALDSAYQDLQILVRTQRGRRVLPVTEVEVFIAESEACCDYVRDLSVYP